MSAARRGAVLVIVGTSTKVLQTTARCQTHLNCVLGVLLFAFITYPCPQNLIYGANITNATMIRYALFAQASITVNYYLQQIHSQ